jgi:hypothetical protein
VVGEEECAVFENARELAISKYPRVLRPYLDTGPKITKIEAGQGEMIDLSNPMN